MQKQMPNRIAELRVAKKLERYDISAALRVDPSTVYRWEEGKSSIPDDKKLELADLLGSSVAQMMGWDRPSRSRANGKAKK